MNGFGLPVRSRATRVAVLAALLIAGSLTVAIRAQEDVFDVPKDGQADEEPERAPRSRPPAEDAEEPPSAEDGNAGGEAERRDATPDDSDEPGESDEPKPEPARRHPEPSKAQQADAEQTIREVYKADYAKAAGRADLAAKLLEQAGESADDAATQFVLLREARDLAAAQGDFETAARAVDALAAGFRVDARAMKAALLTGAAKSARSPEAAAAAVDLAMEMVSGAIERDDYKAAEQFAATARELAKRTKDKAVVAAARDRSAEVKDLSAEFANVRVARTKLAAAADDPAANLLVGRYLCFTKGDWKKGLPLLAKGSDAALQALAKQELGRPSDAADMAKLADG